MANSPAHRFGQIVGEILESAVLPLLEDFAKTHKLYLDKKGDRPCREGAKKCSWIDLNGNTHDLDFVLERGGNPGKKGVPAAFIETAWRRYTKHSRNKAQEIQGAIEPLAMTYQNAHPFKGAILAGEFTGGALTQLRSLGFNVVYFPYATVVAVFGKFGVDAAFDEGTPDAELQRKVDACEALSPRIRRKIAKAMLAANANEVKIFMDALEVVVSRQIESIVILPLHGSRFQIATVADAIAFIEHYHEAGTSQKIERYEIRINYNNGNKIDGRFNDKTSAIEFLRTYEPVLVE